MAIGIADNFLYQGRKPLDSRIVKDTIANMKGMAESIIYDGIMVYNKETKKFYIFNSANEEDSTLGKWRELQTSSADGNATISEYIKNTDYKKNELVIFDNKMYFAANDFKSENTETELKDNFKKDLDNGKLIIVSANAENSDENVICKGYKAGADYKQGTLLVVGDKLYVVTKDFTANNTEATIDDNLKADIEAKNLFNIDTDTDTNCISYEQNKKYSMDKLIRHNNNLYIVNADFISDSTKANCDLSFEVDLESGNLIPIITDKKVSKVSPYQQATQYDKDVLVYVDNVVARVTDNYTSNATESTVQESFDFDITYGKLTLVSSESTDVVLPYEQDKDYTENTLVFLNDKIARVKSDFHSNNAAGNGVKESFDSDIRDGNIFLINTDHVSIMNEYAQDNMYFKDTLVFHGNLIARVLNDFISDDTVGHTIDDSFDADITNANILILNKEAESQILPYKQGTLYEKDKLVFSNKRIGRVLNDYISDNTGTTIEESINIDIANEHLAEMTENYKFKLYRTTVELDKDIDTISTLQVSDIVFENGEDINNMQLYEGIYGAYGTLAIIKDIDVNTGEITIKTINSRAKYIMPPAPDAYEYSIELAGTGYSVGEIIHTTLPDVNVAIDTIGAEGEILSVCHTNETLTNAMGTGATIGAEPKLYVANGKEWYQMPKLEKEETVKEYQQGHDYTKGTLIAFGDILARALVDFTSDSTLSLTEDSFKFDMDSNNLIRITKEDISVPECLGSVKTDDTADLPAVAIKGNWVLVENCKNMAPNQAGIGLYNGTSWDIHPIPQGTFTFPEPSDDGKLYFRKRESGNAEGEWEVFSTVDGNNIEFTVKTKSDTTDNTYVPKANELVWDTNRKILVIGDGTTTLGNLKAFYGSTVTSADILTAIGYTPENIADKGQANGYAPLDANGKVPTGNLPDSMTNTYSKTEIDNKDTAVTNAITTLLNTESSRAKGIEDTLKTSLDTHIADTTIHVTQTEKDAWNDKLDSSDLTDYDNHIAETDIHVTQAEKDKWDGMNKAYYVTDISDLPATDNQIGNVGYVQKSAAGVTPVVCDQYLWDGSKWNQLDANQVSLTFSWGNLKGKPASAPLSIDNAVTVAHGHANKTVLDKIGQSASGNFTYDGVEIGVKVVFLVTEKLLPSEGADNTLYVIYEDSRVRNYPSISIWRDGSYQVLGRGTQDAAPAVGDMNILQSEYFSVIAGSTYKITVNPNQYFAFMPVEILREIEGLKNQEREIINFNDASMFSYNEDLLNITPSSKLTISINKKETHLDTVSDFYYSYVDIDLSDYKDIDNIE